MLVATGGLCTQTVNSMRVSGSKIEDMASGCVIALMVHAMKVNGFRIDRVATGSRCCPVVPVTRVNSCAGRKRVLGAWTGLTALATRARSKEVRSMARAHMLGLTVDDIVATS